MKKLSLNFKKLSLSRAIALKWLPRITLSVSFVVACYAFWFLYQSVLLGVSDAIALETLNKQVLKVRLDVAQFEEVNSDFLQKIQGVQIDITKLRNPFASIVQSTPDTAAENGTNGEAPVAPPPLQNEPPPIP